MDRHQDSANKVPGIALIVSLAPVLLQLLRVNLQIQNSVSGFRILSSTAFLSSSLALIFFPPGHLWEFYLIFWMLGLYGPASLDV